MKKPPEQQRLCRGKKKRLLLAAGRTSRWTLDSIICHELWHATENRILSVNYAAIDPDTWAALNPEGFRYTYDPNQSNPTQKWTLYGGSPDSVYFVDSYACVDEREDRARIMEYFMVHEDEAALLIQSAAIRQKLQLMCAAVRSCFDTNGWKDVRWERLNHTFYSHDPLAKASMSCGFDESFLDFSAVPAELYDAMIFVAEATPIEILESAE